MCFTRVNRLYSVLKKYGSSQYHNKFCDLFAALSLPKVLNIQNLPLHMLTDPTYQRFLQVSFIWHRRFVHCVGFLTMSSLLWRPENLRSVQAFTAKACTRHYVQWQEWYIYSEVSFRTAEKRNLSRFQAMIHWMLHFWDTSDALESPKSSLVSFQSVSLFFTTRCNEDL